MNNYRSLSNYSKDYLDELEYAAENWDDLSDVPNLTRENLINFKKIDAEADNDIMEDDELLDSIDVDFENAWQAANPISYNDLMSEYGLKDSDFM